MNASSRYRERSNHSSLISIATALSIVCDYIKMHTDYIHKDCILLRYRYVLERPKLQQNNNAKKVAALEKSHTKAHTLHIHRQCNLLGNNRI